MTPIRTTGPDPVPLSASSNLRHLVNPLLTVAVYYLVFGVFLKANRGIDNYLRRLTVDVFTFGLTTRSILDGATSITANVGLMRAMRFPRALLPVSTVLARLLTFGFELLAIGFGAVVTGQGLSRRVAHVVNGVSYA
jgi:teichoic acid transport system permease protein